MNSIIKSFLVFMITLLSFNFSEAQIKNTKVVSVKVYGNCGMCKKTIEKAALVKDLSMAEWNVDTKMAKITFDSTRMSADEVLKRIAAAGYDSDTFRADDKAYSNLHKCCQFERPAKKSN